LSSVREQLRYDGALLRRLAYVGSAFGPKPLLEYAPPVLGTLFWAISPRHRAGVRANLRRILGPRPFLDSRRDEVATFVAFARSLAEGMAALGPRAKEVQVVCEGVTQFEQLAARGEGCVFLTAHTSCFEIAASGLGRALGTQVTMVMYPEKNAAAREVSDAVRRRGGLEVTHLADDPLKILDLARQLKAGRAVGLQIDRVPEGVRAIEVPFFGGTLRFPLGALLLARATGVPLMTVFTRRAGYLRARIRASELHYVDKQANHEELTRVATAIVKDLEDWIRAAPTEWLDWGGA
jgi:phosphatidylinositol dimannoside acyltransferase